MEYLGREFHRRSAIDASKDQKQASARLKEATSKGESLQEWFDKEKKKPAPKAEDEDKKKTEKKQDYDPECIICQNEGPRDNNNGKHQHVYSE